LANMICTGGTNWIPYRGTIALCFGDEEECISILFKGADTKGAKGVLEVDRSWKSYVDMLIRDVDVIKTYTGKKVDWTVRIVQLKGYDQTASAKIEICYDEPQSCPTPTVSITDVSNYTPMNGDQVDFTGYVYGGDGQSITSKIWDFGDGTTSTEDAPSKIWTNTTGEDIDYTVTLTATNDCGESNSSTTVITVSSPPKKTGIEIQISDALDGKDLIAYKAIHTIGDLWWTGPAFADGILWTGGRCTWGDIDSSKKYNILVGDACQERAAIDEVVPEHPDSCGGDFADGDNVIILARNPGFDFRVYSSDNLHTLSGSSFSVLYLDSTSGDVIDVAFTGKVCGWLDIEAGTACDAFWAEFYDPIFVANYLNIMFEGEDIFGNEKELTWIDHVSLIAALIGSLPILNLVPLGAVTRNVLEAAVKIVAKMDGLTGDALSKAGASLVDVCKYTPNAVQDMTAEALADFRAALVKVYGDVQGNKYVDDALAAGKALVNKAHGMLTDADLTPAKTHAIRKMFKDNPSLGLEVVEKHLKLITDGTPSLNEVYNHVLIWPQDIVDMYHGGIGNQQEKMLDIGGFFDNLAEDYYSVAEGLGYPRAKAWLQERAKLSLKTLRSPEQEVLETIVESTDEYIHAGKILGDDLPKEVVKATESFNAVPDAEFKAAPKAEFREAAIETEQTFSAACWDVWGAMKDSAKMSNVEKMMVLSIAFATVVLGGLYFYTSDSKDQQAKYAVTHAQFSSELASTYWACDSAEDDERWDNLSDLIADYTNNVKEAEEDLAYRKSVLISDGTYPQFEKTLQLHKFNLNHFIHALDQATNTGTLKVLANVKGFYAQLDETGDLVSDWQSGEVIFNGVSAGEHHAFLTKGGYTSCTTPSGTVTAGNITSVRCDLLPGACILPVPTIDAPVDGVVKKGISFKSSATTASLIEWLEWDFGDGDQSRQQNPSHMYWNSGVYTVQLTVTDDCGSATATHTITITGEGDLPVGTPTPTDDPADDLPDDTATVTVKRPVNAKNGNGIVWPVDCFIYIDGQYTNKKAPSPFSFGGWKELPIGKHTFKIVAEGYQDESVEIDLKVDDELDWMPYMDPVGYTPPEDPPVVDPPVVDPPVTDPPVSGEYAIEFLIPPGATMVLTPITTVPHITVRSTFTDNMRRISER